MGAGLTGSLKFLARTENEAAVELLLAALDCCASPPTRQGTLRALLERRSPDGHRAVFQRLAQLDEACRAIVDERSDRLLPILAGTLAESDPEAAAAACRAVVEFRLYDAVAPLVALLNESKSPHVELAAATIVRLTEQFYAELSAAGGVSPTGRDLDTLRSRITASLEDGVRKYHRHGRPEVVEALLLVARQNNATLRSMIQRPDEKSHQPILDMLEHSAQGGVMRLLLGLLEDPQAPRQAVAVLGRRCDPKFVEHLLRAVGSRPGRAVLDTLARIDAIAWAVPGHEVFAELSDEAHAGAVATLLASGLPRERVFEMLAFLLLEGKPAGRRAAAVALERFSGPVADALVVRGLADPDPEVRAALLIQLRPRGIPNAMSLLLDMVDSPEEVVRDALRKALPELTLRHYLRHFDAMDEALRPVGGHVVMRLESDIEKQLTAEIECISPVRRRRAVMAAAAMGLAGALEASIAQRLSDDDHMVRVAAARALADARSMPTWDALRDALLDRSYVVKEAAEQSLELMCRSLLSSADEDCAEEVVP